MTLKLKYFTVEEAESLIPELEKTMLAAKETKTQIESKVDSWRKVQKTIGEVDAAVFKGQVDFLAAHLEKQLDEITALGALPKDLDLGLVDFPARIDSKEVYLCWKLGESEINYWHGLTEGFQGRKTLKRGH